MKKTYLNSERNSALSSKPSRAIQLLLMVLFFVNTAFGQISQRGAATTANVTNTASLIITKPTGVLVGDVLIANLVQVNSLTAPTAPSGWTLIDSRSLAGGTSRYAAVFYKVAGAAEGANYTFTIPTGASVNVLGAIVAFSGVDVSGATPFDVTPGSISVQGSQTGVAATAITTVSANSAVIMFGETANSIPTWSGWSTTSPGTLTELYDYQGTNTSIGAAWATKATAGSTGVGVATLFSSERNGGILIALKRVTTPPTITSFNPTSGCASSTPVVITGTNFTGATAVTFGGTNALSFTVNSATQITATPAAGTTGTIKVTASGTATSVGTFTVNASASPPTSVTPSANTTRCSGSSISLNATSAGNTIYWYTVATGGSSIGNSASGVNYTFVPSATYTYYAETRSAAGCPSTRVATGSISVTALPVITVQPVAPASVCAGSGTRTISVTATASGTPTYQWRKNGINLTNSAPYTNVTTSTITITNPAISESGAVFDVVVTSSSCPVISNSVSLTVNVSPVATITGASGVCIGSTTTLTAATLGGTWSSNNTAKATVDNNGVVTGVASGGTSPVISYSVTANGCTIIATKTITVSSSPTPLITFTQNQHDVSQSIAACGQVGGGGQNDLDIYSGGPGGSSTYQWQVSTDNGVTWTNGLGPTATQTQYRLDPLFTTFTSNAGVYKFRLIINNNGCSGISDTISLTVTGNTALTAGTISGSISSCSTTSLDPATFTSSAPGGGMGTGTYNYQWQSSIDGVNFVNIAGASGATATTYNSPAITQTTFFRRSVTSGTCSAISNVLSVLVGAPVANVTSQPSCASSTGTVTAPFPISGVTYTITGTNPVTTPVTNPTGIFYGLTPGVYDVVFNSGACISLPKSVTVNAQPLVPSIPVTTIAQPCSVATGIITVTPQNVGDTYTITGTNPVVAPVSNTTGIFSGLAPGNYNVIIKNTLGCTSPSKAITINLNPTIPNTPVIASVIHPNCAVSTGTITVNVQNAMESYSFDNGINFQSSNIKSGLIAGSYKVIIQSAGGCNSPFTQVTINAQPSVPLAPTLTETEPTCALQTGTITITQVGTETYSFDGSAFSNILIYSGLTQGSSHTVIAQNAGGCISSDANISITSLTNTWAAGAWSLDTPTAEQNLVFADSYPPLIDPNVDIEGCSCQVNLGADVIIATGHKMTITNQVVVDGFLTFEDKASLVQINDVANTGDIDYLRTTDTGIYNTDYIYWSSPVQGMTLGDVSQNRTLSDKYYSYEPTATGEDWQQESSLTPMESGKGYIIRGSEYSPSVLPGTKYTATFTGVPNNGHYEITPIYEDKSYLLGNPYPSALDADTFLEDNAGVLNGTLYFWTHNTDMQARGSILSTAGSGAFAYTTNDYATYNATGGVGASPPDLGSSTGPAPIGPNPRPDNNNNTPSGKIASGQGFFASTKIGVTDTKIIFDNTMRVGVIDITKEDNSQFFKTRNPKSKTTKAIEKNRVWLNLTNTQGAFKQTLVGYITDATNNYDDRFDGESFDGNEFVDFYSVNQDKNLTIQGRALPFDAADEVPLGYRTTINGDFTINIAQVDGELTNQAVFIEDKLTNTVTDLKGGNYTFNTVAGTFNDRLVLRYTNANKTLSVDATEKEDGILVLYSNNYNTLIIHNNVVDSTVNTVTLYNISGQKISNWDVKDSEQTTIQIPIKNMSSGIYIVKVDTTKGESSKKIIVN
jgi:hypothetical protein